MTSFEKIIAANKAQLETLTNMTAKTFAGVEKMIDLNMTAAKEALSDAAENAKKSASAKEAQEFLAIQAEMIQPLIEKATAYSRQLYAVALSAGEEMNKSIEAQAAESKAKFMDFVDNASKNAPVGTEPVVAMVKKAVEATNTAVEAAQKSVKQAAANVEKELKSAVENAKVSKKR